MPKKIFTQELEGKGKEGKGREEGKDPEKDGKRK